MPYFVESTNAKKIYKKNIFAPSHFVGGAFLQSWEWGDFQKKIGKSVERVLLRDNTGRVIGRATFLLEKNIPLLPCAYCPGGPCLQYEKISKDQLEEIFAALRKHLSKKGVAFVRFNPPLAKGKFKKIAALKISDAKTKQPERTAYLNLKDEADLLLKKMKQKTRYNIRIAQKHEVSVKTGTSAKEVDIFLELLKKTCERDGFRIHDPGYYKAMIRTMKKSKSVRISIAYYRNEPIAANIIVISDKIATYLHGASADEKRNLMPTYLLQWKTIEDAKDSGFEYYDFWGIDEKKWPGVTRFKTGFGGNEFEMEPTYEIPIKKVRYAIYENIRKLLRK